MLTYIYISHPNCATHMAYFLWLSKHFELRLLSTLSSLEIWRNMSTCQKKMMCNHLHPSVQTTTVLPSGWSQVQPSIIEIMGEMKTISILVAFLLCLFHQVTSFSSVFGRLGSSIGNQKPYFGRSSLLMDGTRSDLRNVAIIAHVDHGEFTCFGLNSFLLLYCWLV